MEQTNSSSGAPTTSAIRTMKGDVARAIAEQQESLVSIALAEQKKKDEARKERERARAEQALREGVIPERRGRSFLVLVFLLLALLIGGSVWAYVFSPESIRSKLPTISFGNTTSEPIVETPLVVEPVVTTPTPPPVSPAIIPAQAESVFTLEAETPLTLFAKIADERLSSDTSWSVKNFIITNTVKGADGSEKVLPISANRFLTLANAGAPEILARSLQSDFMTGLIHEEGTTIPTPFIILKVSDRTTALAGMLQWESKIPALFDAVFGTRIVAGLPPTTKTKDISILGKDARAREITPNIGVVYAFANNTTIVIAGSRTTVATIIPLIQ